MKDNLTSADPLSYNTTNRSRVDLEHPVSVSCLLTLELPHHSFLWSSGSLTWRDRQVSNSSSNYPLLMVLPMAILELVWPCFAIWDNFKTSKPTVFWQYKKKKNYFSTFRIRFFDTSKHLSTSYQNDQLFYLTFWTASLLTLVKIKTKYQQINGKPRRIYLFVFLPQGGFIARDEELIVRVIEFSVE